MNKSQIKGIEYTLFFVTLAVLFFSLYCEYSLGLEPCPLCLMQRLCVLLLLLTIGLGLWLKKAKVLKLSQLFFTTAGLFFALRQLWLQALPLGGAPACMPGLDILIHYFPWQDIVHALLWGSGDCAETALSFLGISLAGWSALYFLIVSLILMLLLFRTKHVA